MRGSISMENISFSRNCDIRPITTNPKSVTDASIWAMFISKNSAMFEIAEYCLFNYSLIIRRYGFHFQSTYDISLTNPIHRIPGQLVNKHG